MAGIKKLLLAALEDLTGESLKDFKWHLSNSNDSGIPRIPVSKLENTNRHDVVDVMVQQYGPSDAGTYAVKVLNSIKQNELASKLTGNLQRVSSDSEEAGAGAGAGATSGAGAGATSGAGVQTSGVSVNIQSSNGASVKAPVVHGGVFNGPVTFN